jgi:hypothetical protein
MSQVPTNLSELMEQLKSLPCREAALQRAKEISDWLEDKMPEGRRSPLADYDFQVGKLLHFLQFGEDETLTKREKQQFEQLVEQLLANERTGNPKPR